MFTKWVSQTAGIRYGWTGETIPGVENSSPSNVGVIKAKSVGGNEYYVNAWSYGKGYSFKTEALTDNASDGIYVGSGTSSEDEDDYTLESVITSGLSATITRSFVYNTSGELIVRYTLLISNTSDAEITIAEVGKVGKVPTASTLGGALNTSAQKAFLLDRTVLETPLVIAAGENGAINYDWVVFEPAVEPEP